MKTVKLISSLVPLLLLIAMAGESLADDERREAVMIPALTSFGDVSVRAGLYLARTADDGSIELQSTIDGSVIRVPAQGGRHSQSVSEDMAVAVRADASQTHLLILSPDGTQRRAIGNTGSGGRSGAARPAAVPAESVLAEVQRSEARVLQDREAVPQTGRLAPSVSGAQLLQERYQQLETQQAQEEEEEPVVEEVVEYMFTVPLDLRSLPQSVENISIWAMLGTAPFNDNALMSDDGGIAVGWGQAFIQVPSNGMLQRNVQVPVDWYGPGTGGNIVPFPSHYVVYIGLNPIGGPRYCGTNTNWETQARCGTTFRPLVTGTLPQE